MTSSDSQAHKFGGLWTLLKLDVLRSYLSFYTTALKNQGYKLVYADAFAGSGDCTISTGDGDSTISGSAKLALQNDPAFHELMFVEANPVRFAALKALSESHPSRKITLFNGDANHVLPKWIGSRSWQNTRGVLFLDPYGMNTDWSLIEQIGATHAIDLWYLFPLSAFFRQAALDFKSVDEGKANALTRMVGTADWHSAFYSHDPQSGLFDDEPEMKRHADVQVMTHFVTERLRTAFAHVEDPLILRHDRNNAPLFALYFAVSNTDYKAIGLAKKAAGHILNKARKTR